MKPVQRAYLELHFAVLLFGLTALLGGLIDLSAVNIVWWRVLLTSISLLFLIKLGEIRRILPTKTILAMMGIGVIVGLHWVTFYGSVKLSNVSICLVGISTTSTFTAILEPLFFKEKIKWLEVGLSLLILPGMILVVNATDWSMLTGLWVALISAFLAALFAIFNKKMITKIGALPITFIELSSAWLFLSIVIPVYYLITLKPIELLPPRPIDWAYLVFLALFCTTLAYVLALRSLKYLSAFAANLTYNLEPVYGILLAWFILKENEQLTTGFYIGAVIIMLAVFMYPVLKRRLVSE